MAQSQVQTDELHISDFSDFSDSESDDQLEKDITSQHFVYQKKLGNQKFTRHLKSEEEFIKTIG